MINTPTLRQLISAVPKEQRICIIRNCEDIVYVGFCADIKDPLGSNPFNPAEQAMEHYVRKIVTDTEVRDKNWRENGHIAPIELEEAPDYEFKDLEQKTYLKIYI
jgi:hypothetical protein